MAGQILTLSAAVKQGKSGLIGGQPTRRRWEALESSLVRPTRAAVQKDCMVVRQQAQSDATRRVAQFGVRKSPSSD
jgi:hypothetical protein